MNQLFINREQDLSFLESRYLSKDAELVVVYGRRRIGKTDTIVQFMRNKPSVYFLATYKSLLDNVNDLRRKFSLFLKDGLFERVAFKNFDDLFEEFVKRMDDKKKVVVVIDEFPLLIDRDKAIPSIFQKLWDECLGRRNIMLILCGSSVSMMETEVLGYRSPLYGRRTGQWMMDELAIWDVRKFFPKYSPEEAVSVYAILGGVPGYLVKFDDKKGVEENVREKILHRGEFLYEEPEFLMREELRDPSNYFSIMRAIAAGKSSFGEIVNETSLDKTLISKYLDVLQRLKLIYRELPLPLSSKEVIRLKKGRYVIGDRFFQFWFNFVYPFRSDIESEVLEPPLRAFHRDFPAFTGSVFESLIRKKQILSKILPFDPSKVGRWWHGDKELDVVAMNGDAFAALEVKWHDFKERAEVEDALEGLSKKMEGLERPGRRVVLTGLVAKSVSPPVKKAMRNKDYIISDLEDILSRGPHSRTASQ